MNFDVRISPSATTREANLARDYWETNDKGGHALKVSDIARRYGLSPHEATTTANRVSSIVSNEVSCACGTALEVAGRANWQYFKNAHKETPWTCGGCERIARGIARKKVADVLKKNAEQSLSRGITYQDLSVADKVYLLAMCENGLIYGLIDGNEESPCCFDHLSWSCEMDHKILSSLESKHIIAIHPDSKGSIYLNDANKVKASKGDVEWIIAVDKSSMEDECNHSQIYDRLKSELYSPSFVEMHKDELSQLAISTVKSAIVELVYYMTSPHAFDSYLTAGKMYPLLDDLLMTYSVSQALFVFQDASQRVEKESDWRSDDEELFLNFAADSIAAITRCGWEIPDIRERSINNIIDTPNLATILLDNILGLDVETYQFRIDDLAA